MGSLPGNRTLTDFCATVQEEEIRDGLRHYTLSGGGGDLFDCSNESPLDHRFVVCELSHLIQRGDKDLIPAMLYYMHEVERQLDGTPTLITVDEGWMPLLHSRLGEKLEEWLRLFRDKNAMLVFASQSVADVAKSTHRDILIEQCPTKLFAPNPEAESASSRQLYLDMGLNDQEIATLRWASPKSQYLYHSPLGRSLFTLTLGRAALSFVGVSGPENVRVVAACADTHGALWPYHWLRQRGCTEEAAWWMADYEQRHNKEERYARCFRCLLLLITMGLTSPWLNKAHAFLGDIVYDPTNYAKNVITAAQMLLQVKNSNSEVAMLLQNLLPALGLRTYPLGLYESLLLADMARAGRRPYSARTLDYYQGDLQQASLALYPGFQSARDYPTHYAASADTLLNTTSSVMGRLGDF